MKHKKVALFIICLFILLFKQSFAQKLYKSVSSEGKIIYSDQKPTDGNIEKSLSLKIVKKPIQLSNQDNSNPQNKQALNNPVIYTAKWCGYCKKALAYLNTNKIFYQNIDIETTDGHIAFTKINNNNKGIPLLLIGGQRLQGFSENAYDKLFLNNQR